MALRSCRECGGSVSTEATSCPHCGCPSPASITGAMSEPASSGVMEPDSTVPSHRSGPACQVRRVPLAEPGSRVPLHVPPARPPREVPSSQIAVSLVTLVALVAGFAFFVWCHPDYWNPGPGRTSWSQYESPRIPDATNRHIKTLADELSELHSRLHVGLDIHDYTQYVGDLQAQFDSLIRDPQVTQHPAYADIQAALTEYRFANDVWSHYFSGGGSNDFLPEWSPYATTLTNEYGVQPTRLLAGKEKVYLPHALSAIWARAGMRVESARANCAER